MVNEYTKINKVAVIGAGTTGIGIAATSVMAGYSVIVLNVHEELLARTRKELTRIVEIGVARGKETDSSARKALASLTFTIHLDALAESDLIIEAAPERFELKRALYADIDTIAQMSAVLTTNTSSLRVNALALQIVLTGSLACIFSIPHIL